MNLDAILTSANSIQLESLLLSAYSENDSLAAEYDDVPFWIEELIDIDQLLQIWWR